MRRPFAFVRSWIGKRAPLVALVLLGTLYFTLTAARDLQPFDSAEFALNAAQLGVGHPPGQPLYLLIGAVLARLVRPAPSFALTLFSAVMTVLCAALVLGRTRRYVPAALALAAFFVPGVWDMATRAEVYPLAAFLVVAGTLRLLSQFNFPVNVAQEGNGAPPSIGAPGRDNASQSKPTCVSPAPSFAPLAGAFFLFALAAAVNPASALAAAAATLPALIWWLAQHASLRTAAVLLAALAVGALGLLPYLALPLLGAHPHGAIVWGEPLHGEALAHYLGGRDYRSWHLTLPEFVDNARAALRWLGTEGMLPFIALGAALELANLGPTPRPLVQRLIPVLGALLSLSIIALNHPFIPTNPDYAGYLLPSLWLSVAALCRGAHTLSSVAPGRRAPVLALACAASLAAFSALAGPPLLSRNRAQSHLTRTLAETMLRETPSNGILLLESDHLVFPALYLQEIEGRRPDVLIINAGWSSSSWYWRHLFFRHPNLPPLPAASTRDERLAAFLAAAARPVAAERLSLAALAPPPVAMPASTSLGEPRARPCLGEILIFAGAPCRPASDVDAWFARNESGPRLDLLPGSFDERVLDQVLLSRADDALRLGQPDRAFAALLAGIPTALAGGLPSTLPPFFTAPPGDPRRADWAAYTHRVLAARTPLLQPRALASPGLLLLRLGDLLAPLDAPSAATAYERAAQPESDSAIERLTTRLSR